MPESFGEQLQNARNERGETLEQVSEIIHVRLRYLEALEAMDLVALPSRVQGKGFLRMYAGYLGLPLAPLLAAFDSQAPRSQPPAPEPLVMKIPSPQPTSAEVSTQAALVEEDLPAESSSASSESESVIEPYILPSEPSPAEAAIAPPPTRPKTAASLLEEIGQALHRQRELLGLTLADVERHTHVRQRYLAALESGHLEDLPSTVQGRGMLSNVAVFLGLDPDQLLTTFAEALQARRLEGMPPVQPVVNPRGKPARRPAQPQAASSWRRLLTPDLLIGATLIIALFLFVLITASRISALQASQVGPTLPPIAEVILQSRTPSLAGTPSPTSPASVSTRLAGENPPASGGASNPADPAATITLPAAASGAVQVVVVAIQRTYLRVIVDGKTDFDGRVLPGNAYPFGGENRIEILIGSAAAIQLFYNRTDLGSLGLVGQVKSFIFTKTGIVTPTAQFTPTRTRTLPPTATSHPSPTIPTATITPYIP